MIDPCLDFNAIDGGRRLAAGNKNRHLACIAPCDNGTGFGRVVTHEPPIATAEKLAVVLGVPAAYFYCNDGRLANFFDPLLDTWRESER